MICWYFVFEWYQTLPTMGQWLITFLSFYNGGKEKWLKSGIYQSGLYIS